nr:uncharacterized protein LOC109193515 [Ipomoea batatas]
MQGTYANSEESYCRSRVCYGDAKSICYCHCGQRLKIQTSWTDANLGRRYWECAYDNQGMGVGGCGFVRWFDPPMCSRSKMIIPGLLRRINRNEQEIEVLKAKIRDTTSIKARNSSVKQKFKCFGTSALILFLFVSMLVFVSNVKPSSVWI